MLLSNARIVIENTFVKRGWLRTNGPLIEAFDRDDEQPHPGEETIDCAGKTIVPGFVDLHAHGGGGASYLGGDPNAIETAASFHRAQGTTRMLASLMAAPVDELERTLDHLASAVESRLIAGVHLEGPFLSPSHCGAQDSRYLREPDVELLAHLLAVGRGCVRLVTIAPELPGATALITLVREAGALVALGHTDATFEEANAAIDAGATVATHLWNAMRPVHQRDPGVIVATLLRDEVSCELIADGVHLQPAIIQMTAELVGNRMVLVSDATAAAGSRDGLLHLGSVDVNVSSGVARVVGSGAIAGSTMTLASIVRYAATDAGIALVDAVRAASTLPARLIGLADECGVIAPGRPADLVLLDEALVTDRVMVEGRFVAPVEPA